MKIASEGIKIEYRMRKGPKTLCTCKHCLPQSLEQFVHQLGVGSFTDDAHDIQLH